MHEVGPGQAGDVESRRTATLNGLTIYLSYKRYRGFLTSFFVCLFLFFVFFNQYHFYLFLGAVLGSLDNWSAFLM